jgi:hypothetical protein
VPPSRAVDVGQRIAVHDEESVGGKSGIARAGRPPTENVRLPRITDIDINLGAVADDARDGVGAMMQVGPFLDARIAQPVQDSNDERVPRPVAAFARTLESG